MDSSTLLCRTPAGDSEATVPANGLSITQRRILTLLDTPARIGDLPVAPALDDERLRREVLRLVQAGLLACEAPSVTAVLDASPSAVVSQRDATGLLRRLSVVLLASAAVALAWAGWRSSANPDLSIDRRTHAGATHNAVTSNPAPPATVPEPRVIATRVLRDPVAARASPPVAKPAADVAPANGIRAAESRSESESPPVLRE